MKDLPLEPNNEDELLLEDEDEVEIKKPSMYRILLLTKLCKSISYAETINT